MLKTTWQPKSPWRCVRDAIRSASLFARQGDDEELVAGFLFTEGIISRREDLLALRMPADTAVERNVVRVDTRSWRARQGG